MSRRFFVILLIVTVIAGSIAVAFVFGSVAPKRLRGDPSVDGPGSRAIIKNSTVYTAWDTPIRGITNSWFGSGDFDVFSSKTKELMQLVRENGLNATHIYVGDWDPDINGRRVGSDAAKIDFAITEAAKNGIYVIMCAGANIDDPQDVEFLKQFWDFYSNRCKDKENVIFEIANEHGWPKSGAQIVADVYNIIRNNAPDTMVLFYSFAASVPPEALTPRIEETERIVDIPWTNEAVAFHAYETRIDDGYGSTWLHHVIDEFTDKGYPIINTEVPCRFELTQYPDVDIYRVLEDRGIAWTGFVNENLISKPCRWRGPFEAEGLVWRPDYGSWPVIDAINPFCVQPAVRNISQTTALVMTNALTMSDGKSVTYSRLNFGVREPLSFRLGVRSEAGGMITISSGGVELGKCELTAGDGYVTVGGYIYTAVSGIADVTFTFTGKGTAYLRDWQFELPKQASYIDPLRITYAASYPYREGGVVRRPGTDAGSPAELQVEGITNGASLLFDFVRFPENESIPFYIRAMPITGGTVEVWAGDFDTVAVCLGECEINGSAGVWADFDCELNIHTSIAGWPVEDGRCPRWDLMLVFKGENDRELFAINEFYFGLTKPGYAYRFEPKVMTGIAWDLTPDSAVIAGSGFVDFDDEDILEAGVLYSVDYYMSFDVYKKTAVPMSPFTVTLDDLQDIDEEFDVPYPVYIQYRAYVTTANSTYLGGVRRFQVVSSGTEPRLELLFTEWNPPAAGSEIILTFESNAPWYIETNVPWLDVSHSNGPRGGGTVLYASENASASSRIGIFTVSILALNNTALITKTVTVTQEGTVG